jgi:hypothetical protein
MICTRSRLSSHYEGLMPSANNGSITKSRFILPWRRRTNLGNYVIVSLRTSMGHLRVMGFTSSFSNSVTTLSQAGKNSACWSGEHLCHIGVIVPLLTIFFCRTHLYELVRDLHRVGIVHGDLEPRNIARVPEGGFRLIDFSESRKHYCKEFLVRYMATPFI